jgi:hypothetical protein
VLVVSVMGFAGVKNVAAQAVEASECCVNLLKPIGARALSLGNAVVARVSPDGMFANPALLGPISEDEFLIHNANSSIVDSNTFTLLISTDVGNFALSYRLNDLGETEVTEGPQSLGTIALLEHVVIATYAAQIAVGLSAGISYKLFQFRLDCNGFCGTEPFSATTHMIDAGAHLRPAAVPGLELGASLVNVGFALQVFNEAQADPSPARLRLGAAYEVLQHMRQDSIAKLWLSVDAINRTSSLGSPLVSIGLELVLEETLFVRAGHGGGSGDIGGTGLGVGLRYDRFDLSVAKSFTSSSFDSDPFQITFGVRF